MAAKTRDIANYKLRDQVTSSESNHHTDPSLRPLCYSSTAKSEDPSHQFEPGIHTTDSKNALGVASHGELHHNKDITGEGTIGDAELHELEDMPSQITNPQKQPSSQEQMGYKKRLHGVRDACFYSGVCHCVPCCILCL